MNCRQIHILISIFLFALNFSVKAEPFIIKKENYSEIILPEKYVYYLEDKTNKLTIDSLLSHPEKFQFKRSNSPNLNFGFSQSSIWLRIEIQNQTSLNKDYLFSIEYPLLNEVHFYTVTDEFHFMKNLSGENYPFKNRIINDRNYVFHLNNFPLENKTYYIKVYNEGETVRIPMRIESPIKGNETATDETFKMAIYYGYLLFSFLLNILLFFNFRKRLYLYFALFVLSFSLFILTIDGFSFQYLWPDFPWFANHSIIFITIFTNFFMLAFTRDFLKFSGKLKHLSNYLTAFYTILFISVFTNYPFYKYVVITANFTTFITVIFIFTAAGYYLKLKNNASTKVFILAFMFVTAGTLIYILRNAGFIPVNYFTQYALKLGFIFQIVVLTFALIIQFKIDLTDINKTLAREVEQQTAEIRAQHDALAEHNIQIESQAKEITDSIVYAKRIQSAVLPDQKRFTFFFEEHFILYKPRNIVSGDFYWYAEKNEKIYIAVADCTGHGVPGGFLSMLGISFLNEIINKELVLSPNLILNDLRRLILNTISSKTTDGLSNSDGMDISLCCIDFKESTLEFSGANNPFFIVRNNMIQEIVADKMPIGQHLKIDKSFTNQEISLYKGDRIYLFSDGFIDQFGGENSKRFSKPKFKKLLTDINKKPFFEQQLYLEQTLEKWKGANEQIDDILIMGLLV